MQSFFLSYKAFVEMQIYKHHRVVVSFTSTLQSSVDIRNYSQCVMEFEFLQDTLREFPSPNHFQPQSETKEALLLRIANMKARISNGARVTPNFTAQKARVK